MADLNYGQIKAELIDYAENDLESAPGGALRLINRCVNYISAFYNDEWEHLLLREVATTLDPTGAYITLPSALNKLRAVYKYTDERGREWEETDFYIEREEDVADLTDAVTRRIVYWKAKTASEARYLSYWRKFIAYTGVDAEVVDMPNSTEAILTVGYWMIARRERNRSQAEKKELQNEADAEIRRLKTHDISRAADSNFDAPTNSMDTVVYPAYDLKNGGLDVNGWNPLTEGID